MKNHCALLSKALTRNYRHRLRRWPLTYATSIQSTGILFRSLLRSMRNWQSAVLLDRWPRQTVNSSAAR